MPILIINVDNRRKWIEWGMCSPCKSQGESLSCILSGGRFFPLPSEPMSRHHLLTALLILELSVVQQN